MYPPKEERTENWKRTPTGASPALPVISGGHRFLRGPLPQPPQAAPTDPAVFPVADAQQYRPGGGFKTFGSAAFDEGWKVHVPKPSEAPVAALEKVFVYLRCKGICHKYVETLKHLAKMESEGQGGKFLTVYPKGEEELLQVVRVIQTLMPKRAVFQNSTLATRDLPVTGDGLITARYGSLTGLFVLSPQAALDPQADMTASDSYVEDDRVRSFKPKHIRNPFDRHSTGADGWWQYPLRPLTSATRVDGVLRPDTLRPRPADAGQEYDPEIRRYRPKPPPPPPMWRAGHLNKRPGDDDNNNRPRKGSGGGMEEYS